MVDRQTDGIAQSTSLIQPSVDRVKAGLTDFAADARDNGGAVAQAPEAARAARNAVEHDARHARQFGRRDRRHALHPSRPGSDAREIQAAVEAASTRGEVSDRRRVRPRLRADPGQQPGPVRRPASATSPTSMSGRSSTGSWPRSRIIGSAITDINGYLPTHLSERSQPQSADPVWNDEHCRNRRIFIDDITRRAHRKRQGGDARHLPHGSRRQVLSRSRTSSCPLYIKRPPLGQFRARLSRRGDAALISPSSRRSPERGPAGRRRPELDRGVAVGPELDAGPDLHRLDEEAADLSEAGEPIVAVQDVHFADAGMEHQISVVLQPDDFQDSAGVAVEDEELRIASRTAARAPPVAGAPPSSSTGSAVRLQVAPSARGRFAPGPCARRAAGRVDDGDRWPRRSPPAAITSRRAGRPPGIRRRDDRALVGLSSPRSAARRAGPSDRRFGRAPIAGR